MQTPAPWFSSPLLSADDGWTFCTVGPFDVSDKSDPNHYEDTIAEVSGINHDALANAQLIAASPDLLAAARAFDDFISLEEADGDDDLWTSEYRAVVEDLRAAIAKATGQPLLPDAVDPVGGSGTDGLRASENRSDPTVAVEARRPAELNLRTLLLSIRADKSAYQWHTAIDNTLRLVVEPDGWQDIATAPMDTEIDVVDGNRVIVAIHRRAGNGFPKRWQGPSADDFTFGGPSLWKPRPTPPVPRPTPEEPDR